MANLPDDIISTIFIRLRAKQIAQIRCLSKSWNAFLSHPSFVKSHLDRSVHTIGGFLLLFTCPFSFDSKPKPFTIRTHPSRSPHLEIPNFIKFPANPQFKTGHGRVVGSINGLVCLEYGSKLDSKFIYIWNPSLSLVLTLPPQSVSSHCDNWLTVNFLRFGFDPQTNYYKVVKLVEASNPRNYAVRKWLQVSVYSMRKGSWEMITQTIPSRITWLCNLDFFCADGHGGHLHWVGKCGCNNLNMIVAFNLGLETFHEMPFPDAIRDFNVDSDHLGVVGGKLCVMSNIRGGGYEVWVMGEYGVAESWVKHHVIPSVIGSELYIKVRPYGFTLHSEFICLVHQNGLALYDPTAATTKRFRLHDGHGWYWGCKVIEYVDSLVWVTPAKSVR